MTPTKENSPEEEERKQATNDTTAEETHCCCAHMCPFRPSSVLPSGGVSCVGCLAEKVPPVDVRPVSEQRLEAAATAPESPEPVRLTHRPTMASSECDTRRRWCSSGGWLARLGSSQSSSRCCCCCHGWPWRSVRQSKNAWQRDAVGGRMERSTAVVRFQVHPFLPPSISPCRCHRRRRDRFVGRTALLRDQPFSLPLTLVCRLVVASFLLCSGRRQQGERRSRHQGGEDAQVALRPVQGRQHARRAARDRTGEAGRAQSRQGRIHQGPQRDAVQIRHL